MPEASSKNILCVYKNYNESAANICCVMICQLIFVIVMWSTLMNKRPLTNMFMSFMFIIALFGSFIIARLLCNSDAENDKARVMAKCMPIATCIMMLLSCFIMFAAFFEGVDDLFGVGLFIAGIISCFFACFWGQLIYSSHIYA